MNLTIREAIPTMGIVIPIYNEEEILDIVILKINDLLHQLISKNKITPKSFVLFVDDGSRDNSWPLLVKNCQLNNLCKSIKLSRNYGHQKALMAGLLTAKNMADCLVSMDADLQDDINLIEKFLDGYMRGFEIIYGIRKSRALDSTIKRRCANFYYKLMIGLGAELKYNHADYRLMTQRVLNHLSEFQESNIFLRGIVPLLGFSSLDLHYNRQERIGGKTKYSIKKIFSLAIDGITSFTTAPLRAITFLGFIVFLVSLTSSIYFLIERYVFHNVVPGWTSIIFSIYMLSGIQLLCLGILGEYIGKIFNESKHRPRFIIEQSLLNVNTE